MRKEKRREGGEGRRYRHRGEGKGERQGWRKEETWRIKGEGAKEKETRGEESEAGGRG